MMHLAWRFGKAYRGRVEMLLCYVCLYLHLVAPRAEGEGRENRGDMYIVKLFGTSALVSSLACMYMCVSAYSDAIRS